MTKTLLQRIATAISTAPQGETYEDCRNNEAKAVLLEIAKWLEEEQKNTKFNLYNRIKPWNSGLDNDIVVEFDASKLTQQNFTLLQQLPLIIQESGEIGEFELDIFKIKIKSLKTYEKDLIFMKN